MVSAAVISASGPMAGKSLSWAASILQILLASCSISHWAPRVSVSLILLKRSLIAGECLANILMAALMLTWALVQLAIAVWIDLDVLRMCARHWMASKRALLLSLIDQSTSQ